MRSKAYAPETPAESAVRFGHLDCVQILVDCGGGRDLYNKIVSSPSVLDTSPYDALLSRPSLLDFECKRLWLRHKLAKVVIFHNGVEDVVREPLRIVSRRGNVCDYHPLYRHL